MSTNRQRRLLPLVTTLALIVPLVVALVLILPLVFALAAPVSAPGTIKVDGGDPDCVGPGQPDPYAVVYCKIGEAMYDASPGDTIHVYPGTYYEEVDLKRMGSPLDITLMTVNDSGIPTPGTATVDATGYTSYGIYALGYPYTGAVTIDGFNVLSAGAYSAVSVYLSGDVVIRNVTAWASGSSGNGIRVSPAAGGTVTITNSVSNDNAGDGIVVSGWDLSGQDVTISNCTANNNGDTGIKVGALSGDVTIENCTAQNNAVGISVYYGPASVTLTNCTASNNVGTWGDGIQFSNQSGDLAITDCIAKDNAQDGISFTGLSGEATRLVNGGIICGNSRHGLSLWSNVSIDATGNWWGCSDGPGEPDCDTIGGDYAASVISDPWIDTVSAGAMVDPVTVGDPTVVSFQFSDTSVYLGEGPGDLHGTAPFTVTTDNGTLNGVGSTIQAGINNPDGVLSVTLVAEITGTATLTLEGPCGLDTTLPLEVEPWWVYVPLVLRNH